MHLFRNVVPTLSNRTSSNGEIWAGGIDAGGTEIGRMMRLEVGKAEIGGVICRIK